MIAIIFPDAHMELEKVIIVLGEKSPFLNDTGWSAEGARYVASGLKVHTFLNERKPAK